LKKNISLLLLIYLLVGCSTDTSEWYDSKEDAIKYGLIQEGSNAILLSVEEYADETIVFIELNNALGVLQ
jgi:PBP1b-binding outer membrane lipoprotein LpoB